MTAGTTRLGPLALLLALAAATAALAAAPAKPRTVRVSVSSSGVEGDRYTWPPALSGNGRFVVFASSAESLDRRDTNGVADIFLHDRKTGKTERVNLSSTGKQANYHHSRDPSISSNGRYVEFRSTATNLAAGDKDTQMDAFVRDRKRKTTTLVSTGKRGATDAVISGNGRFVAFQYYDGLFVRDLKRGRTRRVAAVQTKPVREPPFHPSISANGRFVAYDSRAGNLVAGDTNGRFDVFVRDLKAGRTSRVSVSALGTQLDDGDSEQAMISADGRFVVFASSASGVESSGEDTAGGLFRRDLKSGTPGGSTSTRARFRRTGAAVPPPYRATGSAWRSCPSAATWSRTTRTQRAISSSETSGGGRRVG
jgi:hypothetical protein